MANQDLPGFPSGLHRVSINGKEYVVENITSSNVTPTEIILPPTTILQRLKANGIVRMSHPVADAAYIGPIDAPGMTYVDLCKTIDSLGRIIMVDAKGFVTVIVDGAIAATIFVRHCIGTKVIICPNGRYLSSNGFIHDLQTRRTIKIQHRVRLICFSSDSTRAAYHSGSVIRVIESSTGKIIAAIDNTVFASHIEQLKFYNNNLVVSNAGSIMIIDIQTGQVIAKHVESHDNCYSFQVSNDLVYIEYKNRKQIYVWNGLKKHRRLSNALGLWTIKGRILAGVSWHVMTSKSSTVHVIDASTRRDIRKLHDDFCKKIYAGILTVSPSGQFLMVTKGAQSNIYDVTNGSLCSQLHHAGGISAVHW